ncbi:MAG TPA: redox-regulated ATPase YchF [Virgibacillus sp.]|nr:redox-regulated ATPase YchF [Virgibacillus sp.]
MSLTAGIVGLPNVGKSTLFNAITQAGAESANYPFCTIDPNVGIVEVPDDRLIELTKVVQPKKTVPTAFEFTDIAGIVKGASKGEGLGNQFLSHIRQVDAICHVVRCFEDDNISHVSGSIDPVNDIEVINLELILADLETVTSRLERVQKLVRQKDDAGIAENEVLLIIQKALEEETPVRALEFNEDQEKIVAHLHLLTSKSVLYVANVSEDEVAEPDENEHVKKVKEFASKEGSEVIVICANIEEEIAELDQDEREMFLEDLGIATSGLDLLIKATYQLLGLATYFTAGVQEVRAWTFHKGIKAPQAAGIIHSDFERGFIRAETVAYDDLMEAGSMAQARENGRVRQEGKEYIVEDGDVILFRFNV